MFVANNNNAIMLAHRVKVNCYMVAHTKMSEYGVGRLSVVTAKLDISFWANRD